MQMQPSPDTGSVDFINFDSPLELLQTLLQQLGGAATVNKLCKVYCYYIQSSIRLNHVILYSRCRIKQESHGTKDSRNNMAPSIRYAGLHLKGEGLLK